MTLYPSSPDFMGLLEGKSKSGKQGMMISPECVLKIGVLGLSHKTANLAFRETMARGAGALSGEKALFFSHPTVLLSTCNRTEIYFSSENLADAHGDLLRWLRRQMEEPFEHRLYSYFGLDCFAHLAKVTAGLDSAIIAETEIQRQVKVAYAKASSISSLPSCLHYVFQKALKVGKEIRTQLFIERSAPTLIHAIWQLAEESLGDLREKKILLVGYSDINRKLSSYLVQKGVKEFTLSTKNPASVALTGCKPCDRSELKHWQTYDLIVCAASSDRTLIEGASDRDHVIFDLSVPRNVDPSLGNQLGTILYNIEQLSEWTQQKRIAQSDQLALCNEWIWKEVSKLARGYRQNSLHALKILRG